MGICDKNLVETHQEFQNARQTLKKTWLTLKICVYTKYTYGVETFVTQV